MEVSDKAKRVMVSAAEKLKHLRSQRGGLRLHRTLLLTLAIRSARDLFFAAQTVMAAQVAAERSGAPSGRPTSLSSAGEQVEPLPGDPGCGGPDKGNDCPGSSGHPSRKRRAEAFAEPDFLPCKRSRLGQEDSPQPALASPG